MLAAWWTDRFGMTPPLGYELRAAFGDRWLRIHSLPESKRYPDDAAEQEIILERHTEVATELLQEAPCRVLTVRYEAGVIGHNSSLDGFGEQVFKCVASLADDDDPSEQRSYWARDTTWDPVAERAVLLAIADDQLRAVWLNMRSGEIYAPYDGGADLILATTQRRDTLRRRFARWLSARSDGL